MKLKNGRPRNKEGMFASEVFFIILEIYCSIIKYYSIIYTMMFDKLAKISVLKYFK